MTRIKNGNLTWLFVALSLTVTSVSLSSAQTGASVTITAPSSETTIQPGQTIAITAASSGVDQVTIVGSTPFATTPLQTGGSSLTFSLTIPATIAPGRYYLTGVGIAPNGIVVRSIPTSLVVQNVGVTAIKATPSQIGLQAPGDQYTIAVVGKTAQGSEPMFLDNIVFASANANIATVSADGTVIGQSAGNTRITATYSSGTGTLTSSVNVSIGGAIRGDLDNDGQVDIADVNYLNSILNTPANGPNDAADLNHDGKIDALDARILTTLCTYPRCATRP